MAGLITLRACWWAPEGPHFDDLPFGIEAEGVDHVDPHAMAAVAHGYREGKHGEVAAHADRPFQLELRPWLHGFAIEGADRFATVVGRRADRILDRRIRREQVSDPIGRTGLERGDICLDSGFHFRRFGHGSCFGWSDGEQGGRKDQAKRSKPVEGAGGHARHSGK